MYFIGLINEDGSTEEIELKEGSIYCKCEICGTIYAPPLVCLYEEYRSSIGFGFENLCEDCHKKRAEEEERQQEIRNMEILSEMASRAYKKEITPDDLRSVKSEALESGEEISAILTRRFGPIPRKEYRPRPKKAPAKPAKQVHVE